jgi:hypothetical protein
MRTGICEVKGTAVIVDSPAWKAGIGLNLMLRELKHKSNNTHEIKLKAKAAGCYFDAQSCESQVEHRLSCATLL